MLTLRSTLNMKAGIACAGASNGLTLNRTIRSDVTERRAERMIPKSREVMRAYSFQLLAYRRFVNRVAISPKS